MHGKLQDLTGQRFGRLHVVSRDPVRGCGYALWFCECDCGESTRVRSSRLTGGETQSCGCLVVDVVRAKSTTHGMSGSPTYSSWRAMLSRCTRPKDRSYPQYGGAGITVCSEWESFEIFVRDMGVRPVGTTLDRIDNSQGYCPSNCRWADRKTQERNKRSTQFVTLSGVRLSVADWGDISGVAPQRIRKRLCSGLTPVVSVFYPAKAGTLREDLVSESVLTVSEQLFENWKLSNPNIDKCIAAVHTTWGRNDHNRHSTPDAL